MKLYEEIIFEINDFLWGFFMIVLLLGTHIYMSVKSGFIQKKTFYGISLSFKKEEEAGDISPFQALATSLASTLGTGNIIGVGTAVYLGGPGAVFWCWITGVLGIATKYAESLIAAKYRVYAKDGSVKGGAMYVLKNRLGYKKLSCLFAVSAILASLGVGCGVQINAISEVLKTNASAFGIPDYGVGIFFAIAAGAVIMGGIKSIGQVCEKLIPTACGLFLVGNIVVLVLNYDYILLSLKAIITMAFSSEAVIGGIAGRTFMCALRYGISRGLFSNESGMGSGPIVASAAKGKNYVHQALVASTATFWDTVVLMLVTGVVVVSSILKYPELMSISDSATLTAVVFDKIPVFGSLLMVFGIITFAFSTVLGWQYFGERCFEYLFGEKLTVLYKIIFVLVILISPMAQADFLWTLSDILNALMALPNLIAVIMLADEIQADTKKYFNTWSLERKRNVKKM